MPLLKTTACLLIILNYYCVAQEYSLPEFATPTSYDLYFTIDPENDEYTGIANISFQTSNITKDIYLHSDVNYINITLVILNNNAKCYVDSLHIGDVLIISCTRALLLDVDNSIYIEFTGKFSKDGYGLYKTTYMQGENEEIIIESNFKPTYARRAFPCLDEPAFKAKFSIEITHPKGYTALSTSPMTYVDLREELQKTQFETTPEISAYLVSIFISKFQETEPSNEEDLVFKIYSRPDVASLTKTIAGTYYHQILTKLNDYTGIPYKNLNETESFLVAIPDYIDDVGDFGLFSFKETELLDEGDKTTSKVKQNIISTMAYKLSHEWYGGNVATDWWSDVWANEAVATYMKYIIADQVDEELELTNQFLLEITQKMLHYDGYSFAQPLSSKESDVGSKRTINEKLKPINYEKGASLLHTLRYIVGSGNEAFQSSLQNHFQKRMETESNGIDIIQDILDGMESYYDIDYTYLKNWILSPGYPLLTVSLQESNITDIANITQKRFLYPTDDQNQDDTVWYVPLTSSSQYNHPTEFRVGQFLTPGDHMMYFFGHEYWLIINSLGGCFYRVNYDETMWGRILNGLSNSRDDFHVLQRSQLLDDIFSIARIGEVDYSLAFQMADLLVNETAYYPWYSALNAFSYFLGKLGDKQVELNLKNYILDLMENAIKIPSDNFIEEGDTHIDILKKVLLLEWACYLGHSECIKYTTEKFNKYKESQESLEDYNARSVVFCNGLRYSDNIQEDWDFLWNVYTTSLSVHEQNDILNALGCAGNKDILLAYLNKIITDSSGIKRQDIMMAFNSVFSGYSGKEAAMEFLKDNNAVGDSISNFFWGAEIFSEMLYVVAEKLVSDDDLEWLESLYLGGYDDVKTRAKTLASVNNYWAKNFRKGVLNLFPYASTEPTSSGPTTEPVTTEGTSTTTESKGEKLTITRLSLLFVMMTCATLAIN